MIAIQLQSRDSFRGDVYNAGGGLAAARRLPSSPRSASGHGTSPDIQARDATRLGDVPIYITDNRKVTSQFGWSPARSTTNLADDLFQWIDRHRDALQAAFG